jgi:uncharacterized phage protein (TIGR01671 family)
MTFKELKFRVWVAEQKHFYFFNLETLQFVLRNNHFSPDNTVQRFTGRVDVNGRHLYEGDIVRVMSRGDWFDDEITYYNTIVTFNNSIGAFTTKTQKAIDEHPEYNGTFLYTHESVEIIGNIFEGENK